MQLCSLTQMWRLHQSRSVLTMSIGGSWRTSCFLTSRKWKRCCAARRCIVTRWIPLHGGVEVVGTAVKFGDFIKLLGVKLDPSISMNHHVTELVRSGNYHIRALRHIRPLLTLESTKMVAMELLPRALTTAIRSSTARPLIISGSCRWHRMHWPKLYAKLWEHVVPLKCVANYTGY